MVLDILMNNIENEWAQLRHSLIKKQVKYLVKFQNEESLIRFASLLRQTIQKDALLKIQIWLQMCRMH